MLKELLVVTEYPSKYKVSKKVGELEQNKKYQEGFSDGYRLGYAKAIEEVKNKGTVA